MSIRQAGPFWQVALRITGMHGLTMPWGVAYVHPDHDCEQLRAHEQVHLDQIVHYGAIKFSALYLWWLVRHGYYWHPMEIEARVKAGEWEPQPHWQKDPRLSKYWKGGCDGQTSSANTKI